MKQELRDICEIEINRIREAQERGPLDNEAVSKLQKLISSLKTLEEAKTPDSDSVAAFLKVSSKEDLLEILDATEG
jgi:hypothetical protein